MIAHHPDTADHRETKVLADAADRIALLRLRSDPDSTARAIALATTILLRRVDAVRGVA